MYIFEVKGQVNRMKEAELEIESTENEIVEYQDMSPNWQKRIIGNFKVLGSLALPISRLMFHMQQQGRNDLERDIIDKNRILRSPPSNAGREEKATFQQFYPLTYGNFRYYWDDKDGENAENGGESLRNEGTDIISHVLGEGSIEEASRLHWIKHGLCRHIQKDVVTY